jgi:NADH-quinone oxidoreductase subunit J
MAIAVVSGIMILFVRNILYCAYLLALCLLSVAAMYVFAGNSFLAVSQVMVYVGGVVVIIVFGVMVTARGENGQLQAKLRHRFSGVLLGLGVLLVFFTLFSGVAQASNKPIEDVSIHLLGKEIMTTYLLAFESIAILLLIAIVGSAVMARSKRLNGER